MQMYKLCHIVRDVIVDVGPAVFTTSAVVDTGVQCQSVTVHPPRTNVADVQLKSYIICMTSIAHPHILHILYVRQ